MIMNIFEKAGITPGPWRAMKPKKSNGFWYVGPEEDRTGSTATCYEDDPLSKSNARLIAVAPEMLETLIEEWNMIEVFLALEADNIMPSSYNMLYEKQHKIQTLIQKATGLSWEQINAE